MLNTLSAVASQIKGYLRLQSVEQPETSSTAILAVGESLPAIPSIEDYPMGFLLSKVNSASLKVLTRDSDSRPIFHGQPKIGPDNRLSTPTAREYEEHFREEASETRRTQAQITLLQTRQRTHPSLSLYNIKVVNKSPYPSLRFEVMLKEGGRLLRPRPQVDFEELDSIPQEPYLLPFSIHSPASTPTHNDANFLLTNLEDPELQLLVTDGKTGKTTLPLIKTQPNPEAPAFYTAIIPETFNLMRENREDLGVHIVNPLLAATLRRQGREIPDTDDFYKFLGGSGGLEIATRS